MVGLLAVSDGGSLDPMEHVLPHYPFGGTWFTNHHLMSLVVAILGILMLWAVAKRLPARGQRAEDYVTKGRLTQMFETICIFLRDEMTRPLLGELTDKYISYVWSTFFFILLANLLGLIPLGAVFGLLGFENLSHAWGTMTGNINFTGGLAIIAYFMMFYVGIRESGVDYFKHMWVVPLQPRWLSPLLIVIGAFVFVIELVVSPLARAFALCIRLFANMVAGHLVIASLVIMILTAPVLGKGVGALGTAAFMFLELFVAFLQAYIFTFLTVIFISLGAVHHGEHDEHEAGLDEGERPGEAVDQSLTGTHAVAS